MNCAETAPVGRVFYQYSGSGSPRKPCCKVTLVCHLLLLATVVDRATVQVVDDSMHPTSFTARLSLPQLMLLPAPRDSFVKRLSRRLFV